MRPTVFQRAELRDENDNIIQQGTYGKGSALSNSTNDGWVDYVMNNLEALYGIAKDEVVPVSALPASGDMNKTYLLTTTGVCYRWDGTAWVEISSSEAVGRAESAATLAEQWATKTDGTVDGSEYSAKHYANAAQQSADDAQDVADDMATHLSQIDQNTGGVSANSKRIGNIEKLLQGNLYDYDTDDDTAYTKSVPSGAMPYAGLEKVGGKTIVWNQLVYDPTMTSASNWQMYIAAGNYSITASDNVLKVLQTAGDANFLLGTKTNAPTLVNGHKYYMAADIRSNASRNAQFDAGSTYSTNFSLTTSFKRFSSVITTAAVSQRFGIYIYWGNISIDDWIEVKNFIGVDLTAMFGAGNEPTVEEFESMFPASYYPYNAGTLLSAGVTEVVSKGKNLINEANVYSFTKMQYEGGVFTNTATDNKTTFSLILQYLENGSYKGNVANQQPTTIGTNSVTFTATVSCNQLSVGHNGSVQDLKLTFYADIVAGKTYTLSINVISNIANQVGGIQFKDVMLEESATATNYVPYMTPIQYPIPAEVQALEGYGWSAGSVYNYIDYERKVFVKNVDKVIITKDSAISAEGSVGDFYRYYIDKDGMKRNYSHDPVVGYNEMMVSDYGIVRYDRNTDGNSVGVSGFGNVLTSLPGRNWLYMFATQSTVADFKTYLADHPITVYYELATPIEVDISEYLTDDNLIQVEAGGTLTFPNSNGDDYRLPVPSEEEYMIDLQEAINNG